GGARPVGAAGRDREVARRRGSRTRRRDSAPGARRDRLHARAFAALPDAPALGVARRVRQRNLVAAAARPRGREARRRCAMADDRRAVGGAAAVGGPAAAGGPPRVGGPAPTLRKGSAWLADFFFPRRIAVIGASDDTTRIRGRFIVLLRQHGFDGEIIPVTPSRSAVQGLPAVPRIGAIPGAPVDLALVAVPAPAVVGVLRECAAAGVRGAIVFTSGFAEEGGAMAAAQEEISRIARETGMRIGGPNAMGYFNARGRVAATFSQAIDTEEAARGIDASELPGGVAIVSQSGGLGFSIYNRALRRRIGGDFVVGTGNEADLGALDFAEFLVEDPGVRQMLLFLEGVRDG